MLDTRPLLELSNFPQIQRLAVDTLQVNLGYLCNLSCVHCHVNAGPRRTELMDADNIAVVLDYVEQRDIQLIDITGGSPEMNPHFTELVRRARALGVRVMDRLNPTILMEPGYEDIAEFLAENCVEITASLPCYAEQNVDQQRGKGVYKDSIQALRKLNQLGYAQPDSGLILNLVYNPTGPHLPPAQLPLQQQYKQSLLQEHGIEFNELFVLTNMPISRFGSTLVSKGQFNDYMNLLQENYQPANLDTVMCRSLISVDWQGYVYDCDFNQMLDMPMIASDRKKIHLRELLDTELQGRSIRVAAHCYGCTAGQGSSCGGALS